MADRPAPPPTLQSIAATLGVHVSTVSRVLSGGGTGARAASPQTAARIRALADELGYRPNPHAASLRTRRSNSIGVLVPRLSDLVLATIYEGIEEAAAERGLSTFVANTRDDPALQRTQTALALGRRADGLIFGDAHLDARLVDEVAADGVRFVLVNRRAGEHPAVTCDDHAGGRLAAEHLLALGHRDVGVVAGPPHASTAADRTAGFVQAFAAAGAPIASERIVPSAFDIAGARSAAERMLAGGDHPSAIFAVNDFAAIGAMGAVRDRGLRVGEDVALVGFNDTPLAAQLPIALTSVRSPMHEMGRRALDLLTRVLAGEAVESERLAPSLVERSSSTG